MVQKSAGKMPARQPPRRRRYTAVEDYNFPRCFRPFWPVGIPVAAAAVLSS
jgi:hypothetical protein